MSFDARLTPARGDLAASSLRGKVEAKTFVDGVAHSVAKGRTPLRAGPSATAGQASELLFGEPLTVYERKESWAWVQSGLDAYVGYVPESVLGEPVAATHRVCALATPLLPAPDVKRPLLDLLPMNARVAAQGREGAFVRIAPRGFVFAAHLRPLDETERDWVLAAGRFVGAPYVWGGKTLFGLDCSGLVQTALQSAGMACPRDTDLQEKALGTEIGDLTHVQRGDLVFWKGHVGIVLEGGRLLHANAHFMNVSIEPLADAIARIAASGNKVTSIKRL